VQLEKQLNSLKQDSPVIINVIEQLSNLLPKDTWLRSFEYKNNKFLLQGASASSSKLIELLESSPYFKQTAMVSPVTRDSVEGVDEFQLETLRESPNDPK
jgi:general secretion pathway protein L